MRLMRIVVPAALGLVLLLSGCVLRGPAEIRSQVEHASGRSYDREFGLTLGRTGMTLTRWIVRHSDEDGAADLLRGINKIQVGVYEAAGDRSGRLPVASDFDPYDPLVQIREDDEAVLVLALARDNAIRKMLVVVDSSDELVIVRLRGDLDQVIEGAIRLGLEQGGREELAGPVIDEYRRGHGVSRPVFL